MAQGLFVASHDASSSSAELVPGRALVRNCLHKGHTYDWLFDRDVELPQWLTEKDD